MTPWFPSFTSLTRSHHLCSGPPQWQAAQRTDDEMDIVPEGNLLYIDPHYHPSMPFGSLWSRPRWSWHRKHRRFPRDCRHQPRHHSLTCWLSCRVWLSASFSNASRAVVSAATASSNLGEFPTRSSDPFAHVSIRQRDHPMGIFLESVANSPPSWWINMDFFQWTFLGTLITSPQLQNPSNFWIVAFNASAAVSASLLSASLPSCSAVYSDRARFNWEFRSAMSSLALVWMDCPSCTADACSSCSVSICLWKFSALLRASLSFSSRAFVSAATASCNFWIVAFNSCKESELENTQLMQSWHGFLRNGMPNIWRS